MPSASSSLLSLVLGLSAILLMPGGVQASSEEDCFGSPDPVPDGVIEAEAAAALRNRLLEAGPQCAPALITLLEKQPTGVLSEATVEVVVGWNDPTVLPMLYKAFGESQIRAYGRNEDMAFAMAGAIAGLLGPDADLLEPLRTGGCCEDWLDRAAARYLEEWGPELSDEARPPPSSRTRSEAQVHWRACLDGLTQVPPDPFDPLGLQRGPTHELSVGTRCASLGVLTAWLQSDEEAWRTQVDDILQRYSQTGDLNQISISLERSWGQKVTSVDGSAVSWDSPLGPQLEVLPWKGLAGFLVLLLGLLALRPSRKKRSEGVTVQWPWQKNWWLSLMGQLFAVSLGVIALVAMEMVCRVAGVQPGDEARPIRDLPSMLVDGSGEGRVVKDARFRLHSQTPPEGTARIAVVGASTVAGPGLPEQETISGLLRSKLAPEIPCLEVLNLGHHGFASPGLRALGLFALDEVGADLIILYGGHNEVGSMRERDRFLQFRSAGYRLRSRLLRTHLAGLLMPLLNPIFSVPTAPDKGPGEEASEQPGDWVDRHHPPFERAVTLRFERELSDLVRAVHRRDRDLVLVQPSFNHHGLRVGRWDPETGQVPKVTADQIMNRLGEGDGEEATKHAERLVALDPGHPTPWCLLALARELNGDLLGAEVAVWECSRRNQGGSAITPGVAEQLATVAAKYGVPIADAHGALHAASGGHLPGFNLFTDYVHLNQLGTEVVTASITETLQRTGLTEELANLCRAE